MQSGTRPERPTRRAGKMVVDVKAALLSRQQKTETDRAHVKRWLAVANDPVWQKVAIEFAANIKTLSEEELFTVVIEAALRFRRYAENARYETAELIREREQKKQKRRQKLLSLASNIEDIVGRLRRDRINWAPFSRDPNSPSNLEARQSLEWLEREIKFIRRSTKPEIFELGQIRSNYREPAKRWAGETPPVTRDRTFHQAFDQRNDFARREAPVRLCCKANKRRLSRPRRRGRGRSPTL